MVADNISTNRICEGRSKKPVLTNLVHGHFHWHALRDARKHIHRLVCAEEAAAEVGEVADKKARVEVALCEVRTGVFEECFGEALKPDALVDVAQFLRLCSVGWMMRMMGLGSLRSTHLVFVDGYSARV